MRRSAESKFGYRAGFSLSFELFCSQRLWNTLEGTKSTSTFSFRSAKKVWNIKNSGVNIRRSITRIASQIESWRTAEFESISSAFRRYERTVNEVRDFSAEFR